MGTRPRFVATTRDKSRATRVAARSEPRLVIAHHPRLARAGELLALDQPVTELARLAPSFVAADGSDAGPLDDPFLSRSAIAIRRLPRGAVELDNPHGVELAIGGVPLAEGAIRRITVEALARGIDLVLGGRVVLWLGLDAQHEADDLGLAGCSPAIRALRDEIRQAAQLAGPILVAGETGSGKELVARALHACSPRAQAPFEVVNVAAIPAAVAAAELFGHERGAFTGAGDKRTGTFERANGGVLFLDEIGELPEAVQPVLLRALESGEIQPVGGPPRRVDVMVIAATDADLERAATAGRFRGPLYYRLAATTIRVPPLRERGADIGLLFAGFAAFVLPESDRDQTTAEHPTLPAEVVAELMRRRWPGNVRQLRSAAHQLALRARAGKLVEAGDLGAGLPDDVPELQGEAIDDARLVATLREHGYQLTRTAEALAISRTHLDALIARSPSVRKAKDLERDEIAASAKATDGDVDAMAGKLEVSPRGLRLRMRQLGL